MKNQAILRVFVEMITSLNIKRFLIVPLAVAVGLISCSDKQTDEGKPAEQDTVVSAADSVKKPETIRMVVGGTLPSGPEKLLPIDPATFDDWKVVRFENIKLLCPKDHAHAATVDGLARAIHRALNNACRFMSVNVPTDTIVVIYYTGPGHGKEITGMNYSLAIGDTLHYWPPNNLGVPVTKYVIPKWQNIQPRHDFLRQGLITLLDGSGKDYHKWTLTAFEENRFTPLSELAVDSTISADEGGQPVALSASFVDFVVYSYGIDGLSKLYRSHDDFDKAVEGSFGITTDSLQTQWITVLKQVKEILKQSGQ